MTRTKNVRPWSTRDGGEPHIVSYRNTDLLKHEVAFYNPNGLNPDEMLNCILDEYFCFAKKLRAQEANV